MPMSMSIALRTQPLWVCLAGFVLVLPAWASDPAQREVRRSQQVRQHQQDELQLRMQQYHRSLEAPPTDARRQLEIDQRRRQQQLHYRQSIEVQPPSPADDEGTHRAKAQIEQQRAQQESERELQRFDRELQQRR
jgi:hypothetical protein